ncbi:hypothetical protein DSO57_1014805 [Entomophthora muscae]|uniref:Uncharacterized protein n=1 Tax=Entomophthora muscae TaxID=34485 RepID=A0ACC2UQ50_9FUNG|nr:hypothetical protein DSO57_1014805 [Entomophthora muscae]
MNLRSFNWKLGYSSKRKGTSADDQNSSLLFDEFDAQTSTEPPSSSTQSQTTVLFNNENAFDGFVSPPKTPFQQDLLAGSSLGAQPSKHFPKSSLNDFSDLLGDLDFSRPEGTSQAATLSQSFTTPIGDLPQAEFGDFVVASGENDFGAFSEVNLKPAESDDFGDFFLFTRL